MEEEKLPFQKWVPDDFFNWMDFFYRLKGLNPPKHKTWRMIYYSISLPNIFACTVLLISLEWIGFFTMDQDFKYKMKNSSSALLDTIVVFRTAMWFLTKPQLDGLREVIGRESFSFECFGIKRIHRKDGFLKKGTSDFRDYNRLNRYWKDADVEYNMFGNNLQAFRNRILSYTRFGCCLLYISISAISIMTNVLAFVCELMSETEIYSAFNPKLDKISKYRVYHYPIYFPFDVSFDGYYWFGLIYNYYARLVNILLFLPIETLLTCSIIHLIGQAIIVREAFAYIDKGFPDDESPEEILIVKEFRIVRCINELQQIYRAIEILEDVCNNQLLIQYGFATFLLCSVCYVIPLVDNWIEGLIYMIFMIASLGEVFIFSYCCQTLAVTLQEVAISVYDLNWPTYSMKMKKTLCFHLKRLQKPANLTAGKIVNIDLLFFMKVIQKSYSFYTLISNTKSKK